MYSTFKKSGKCYIDIETKGLNPRKGVIGVITLYDGKSFFVLREITKDLIKILEDNSITKIGFNLKFDFSFFIVAIPGIKIRNVRDLYIEELLISGPRNNTLQEVLERRTGIEISKDVDHSVVDWTGKLDSKMEEYIREDVVHLPKLADILYDLLTETKQHKAADIENAAIVASAYMEVNGVMFDLVLFQAFIEDSKVKAEESLLKLKSYADINWNSPKQVLEYLNPLLKKKKIFLTSVAHDKLVKISGMHPSVDILLDYRKYAKRASSWGDKYLNKWIDPVTHRIHCQWNQFGAATGRFSSSNPNMQQLPRDNEFRRIIIAKPGHSLVSVDYQQIEVLVAAVVSKDENMLRNFNLGIDTHTQAVHIVTGKSIDAITKQERFLGKAVNFGLLFAGGAKMLANYARTTFGVTNFSEEDAAKAIKAYFEYYKGLGALRQKAYDWTFKAKSKGVGVVRNLVGMRREVRGKDIKPTTCLNTIIQSSAGYGIKNALGKLVDFGYLVWLLAQIHDELLFEVPDEEVELFVVNIQAIMIDAMKEVLGNYPVKVDIQVGKSWAEE